MRLARFICNVPCAGCRGSRSGAKIHYCEDGHINDAGKGQAYTSHLRFIYNTVLTLKKKITAKDLRRRLWPKVSPMNICQQDLPGFISKEMI